jgi:hypothetical protein
MDPTESWMWSEIDFQHDFYDEEDGEEEYVCTQFETYIGESSNLADGGSFFFWVEATLGDCDDNAYCSSTIGCQDSETCPPELTENYGWFFYDLSEEEYLNCKMAIEQLLATY